MKKLIGALLTTLCMSAYAQVVSWPQLPSSGFVRGKAASKADVESGQAVFVAAIGDTVIGRPLPIQIPQYAWSKSAGKNQPAIIIQAEEANGQKLIGARLLNGEYIAGFLTDFELLGTSIPK